MNKVKVVTSDNTIWNKEQVYTELACAILAKKPFAIDLLNEAPDLEVIGLYRYLEESDLNLEDVTIYTANMLEQHDKIHIVYRPPIHLLQNAKEYITDISKNQQLQHFGMFIGRSNAPRLYLATYLKQCHPDKSLLTYHFDFSDDFHSNNIGLENLIKYYGIKDIHRESMFLSLCPITLENSQPIRNNKNLKLNHAQQLLKNDQTYFSQTYNHFFVELVCESFYTGNTFFTTEKIFRPILLKTPFIVQGPQNFLKNLKKLGFKTFSSWWDEGYDEDPVEHQLLEIKKILDFLSIKTSTELQKMYQEMQEILEHNYQVAVNLDKNDFKKLHEQR
jgi:hypothetical protein